MMKIIILKYYYILLLISFSVIVNSCGTARYDDAVRIKSDSAYKYLQHPVTRELRESGTLRGMVVNVNVVSVPDSCPADGEVTFSADTSIVFVDQTVPANPANYEFIPVSDIVLVRDIVELNENGYNNVNVFENYNDPQQLRNLREVAVNEVVVDTCCPCRCVPWDANLDMNLSLSCPKRDYFWWFLDLKGAYAVYMDMANLNDEIARTSLMGEATAGVRFGGRKEWGAGVSLSSGIRAYDSHKEEDALRPTVLLHGRYRSESLLGECLKPFAFIEFGIPIDGLSWAIPQFKYSTSCENCKKYIDELSASGLLPEVDLGLPISFAFGAGVNIPITKYFDLSFDLSFRSIGIGESVEAAGFDNIPSLRRINMMVLRMGFTI